MSSKPQVAFGVLIWVVIAVMVALVFFVGIHAVHAGHLAPGCDNQEFRPRIVGCCPRFLSGETLPPQCLRWSASGHLAQCCGGIPRPSPTMTFGMLPTPENTATPCFNGYDFVPCPGATWTPPCNIHPTPLPTPETRAKGDCCREVRQTYSVARRAIVAQEKAALKALVRWKLEQMHECREGY